MPNDTLTAMRQSIIDGAPDTASSLAQQSLIAESSGLREHGSGRHDMAAEGEGRPLPAGAPSHHGAVCLCLRAGCARVLVGIDRAPGNRDRIDGDDKVANDRVRPSNALVRGIPLACEEGRTPQA